MRFYEELGQELERVVRQQSESRASRLVRFGRGARLSTAVIVVALLLLLAGVAAAAVLLIRTGSPLTAPPDGALGAFARPIPSTVRLAGLDAPNPGGGPPWDIRISRSRTGATCTAVGQVVRGRLGVIGLDGVFRPLELGGVDACGVRGLAGPVLAGAREFIGRTEAQARTVVNGVAGAGARSVTVYGPGGVRRLRLGPDGSFITVYRGYVEDVRPRVVAVEANGRADTIALARTTTPQIADPDGGAPWEVTGGADLEPRAPVDEQCVQVTEAHRPPEPGAGRRPIGQGGPFGGQLFGPFTPQICGRLATQPLFVAMQRFDPDRGSWGDVPARTILYGAAAPRVASLSLRVGTGPAQTVAINRSTGGFAAVLDGHQSPSDLTLTARLASGAMLTLHGSSDLYTQGGRPTSEPAPSPYRAPTPSPARLEQVLHAPVIAGTVAQSLHAHDPAGGSEWTLRSWQASSIRFGRGHQTGRRSCWEVGVLVHGRLMQPTLTGRAVPFTHAAQCFPQLSAPDILGQAYLSDPFSYAPTPARVVITGLVPRGTVSARLDGVAARAIEVDRNGVFLAVLPGHYWNTSVRVTATLAGGRTITSRYGTNPPSELGGRGVTPYAIAPDPDGGPPWGFRAGAHSEVDGQVLDDRFIAVLAGDEDGQFQVGPDSSGGSAFASHPNPLQLLPDLEDIVDPNPAALTPEQIERRTLSGRTVIAGLAAPDVVSVTITTPRDVRTVTPLGAHRAFIVVYDGFFYGSTVTATAKLRDGRTVTDDVQGATYPNPGGGSSSLQAILAHVTRARARIRSLGHLPAGYLRRAEASNRRMIQAITRRLRYEHGHPGVLPPD